MQEVQLSGITRQDVQDIFTKTLQEFKTAKTRVVYLDASYLYNFDKSDFQLIRNLTKLVRYSTKNAVEWHRLLERWYSDQTVSINDRQIKPLKILRTFDKVPNEGLEMTAACWAGQGASVFNFHALGNGTVTQALPSDTTLVNEISRIDVTQDPNGGSLTRDGSTLYVIGNHPITVETADITESGVFDSDNPTNDIMLDHAVFDDEVEHTINSDVPGSTTIIYQCSA